MNMRPPEMSRNIGCALLVSDDPESSTQFSHCFHQLAIATEICVEPKAATRLLFQRRFDAVVIDLKSGSAARTMLEELRCSPATQKAVTFVVRDLSANDDGFDSKAMFEVERGLSVDRLEHFLRASYGMIVRARRQYFRCPVSVPATLRLADGKADNFCTVVNVSEGGIALSTTSRMPVDAYASVQFTLPRRWAPFDAKAKVCWSTSTGKTGMQFVLISTQQQFRLQSWILRKLERSLPLSVAQRLKREIEL